MMQTLVEADCSEGKVNPFQVGPNQTFCCLYQVSDVAVALSLVLFARLCSLLELQQYFCVEWRF